jgi:YVTN family beta-propeller protein
VCLFLSCSGDSAAPPALPTLTAISPTSGVQGTTFTATITGTNFVTGGTNTLVASGNGITVSNVGVTSSTSATATVAIAADAPLGTRTFTLTTAAGASGTISFTVLPPVPTLSSLNPSTVVEGATVTETLTGTNFVTGATTVAVSGAGVAVSSVNVTSATSLTASFAVNSAADLGTRQVTVTTAGGTSAAQTLTINPPAPVLQKVDPNSGMASTTVHVTLTGTWFVPGATTISVGGTGVSVSNLAFPVQDPITSSAVPGNGTSIQADFVISPTATPGAHAVTVTTVGGTSNALPFTVSAPPSPAIGSFGANPATIDLGQTSSLVWSGITNATTCTIDNGIGSVSCAGGSMTVQPTASTIYILTASGPGGSVIARATVTLSSASIGSFSANPATILAGASTTLSWSTIRNATDCFIDNGVGRVTCGEQHISVSPAATTTYTLTVSGPIGSATAATTVTVNPQPPHIGAFTANPTAVLLGNSSALSWTGITNATTCAIDNGVGTVSCADGTTNVSPVATTTYTLTATGPGGTITSTAIVTVNVVAPTLTTVNPNVGVQSTTVAVTLTGTNFVVGGTTLAVNGTGVSVNSVSVSSSTSLTANFVIAAGATLGAHNVTVTTASGTSGPQTFIVNPPPPTLTSVTPSQGAQGGTQNITLVGTNFVSSATTVSVSGSNVTVSNVNVSSATQLTADFAVGAGAALGARNVTVTTAGGTSGAQTFTVIVPPTINAFNSLATHLTAVQPAQLRWSTSNATTCSIDNGVGVASCNGSLFVTPGTTRTYTLSASNAGVTVTANFQIFANEPGRFVYSTSPGGAAGTHVHQFSLDANTGDLTAIGTGLATSGNTTLGVTVDPSGSYAYVVNDGSNSISMYSIDHTTGALTSRGTIAAGSSPREIVVDPTGRFAYVTNQTAGGISRYTIDGTGLLVANGSTALGTSPRGIAIDGTGRFLYAANRDDNTLQEFSINSDGTLSSLGTISTSTRPFEIATDPTGRFLYLTHDTQGKISQYSINSDGTLTLLGGGAVLLSTPAGTIDAVTVDPTGRFAYAIDFNNSILHEFSIDQTTGILTRFAAPTLPHTLPTTQTIVTFGIDPQGKFAYATDSNNGQLILFTIDANGALAPVTAPLRTIAGGSSPFGVVVSR